LGRSILPLFLLLHVGTLLQSRQRPDRPVDFVWVWFHLECQISDSYQVGEEMDTTVACVCADWPRVVSLTNKLTRCLIAQLCCSVDLTHRPRLSLALAVDCRFLSSLSARVCHPSLLNAHTIIAFASKRLLSTPSWIEVVLLVVVVLLEVSLSASGN